MPIETETAVTTTDNDATDIAATYSLEQIRHLLAQTPFVPHKLFRHGHAQTIAAHLAPRRKYLQPAHEADEARFFRTDEGVQVLAHCRWQENRTAHPTLILIHGLEGSSASIYVLGTAAKAFAANFNVVRLNMRNCGATEHLTPTLYNSGMTTDARSVITELIEKDNLKRIYLAGFSMGGNVALKLAGEWSHHAPPQLQGVCAVSPALDLAACAHAIESRDNRIYQFRFVRSLRARMKRKQQLYPDAYDLQHLRRVRTIRDFDEIFTAPHGGYTNAADYYAKASALPLVARIKTPTLIIAAHDDPFIPFASFNDERLKSNSHIVLLAPQHGGHVGFLAEKSEPHGDRFWAEHRITEFCRAINAQA